MKEKGTKITNASKKAAPSKRAPRKKVQEAIASSPPLMTGEYESTASTTSTRSRRNRAGSIHRTDRFKNIEDGLVPFHYSSGLENKSNLNVRDAVMLCQKAYYNFAIFRNTIDLMTEFSISSIYYRGGSKKSRDFFESYFKKINIWALQDQFFREYYRSGNVFLYRLDANLRKKDVNKITKTFGGTSSARVLLPSRYIVLNPADIQIAGSASFATGNYYKVLSDYELERLRSPRTEEDEQILQNLDPEIREKIQTKGNSLVLLPLGTDKITAVFYKKQDYEPFAIPMGYPVLADINWKEEMKKMDMAITRTTQQAILLVTMGAEPDKGGVNQKNLQAMQNLFQNESVGRVLIADYTTKAEFVIPDIASILDPKKYEVVNSDIQIGLNNIFVGTGERFANQNIKVEIFIGRLRQARQAFINDFLLPEIKRIAKQLGFKNFPRPEFERISLKDDTNISRIYNRLIEIGVLTPEEGVTAIETGKLPDADDSVTNQTAYKKMRDKGLYEPVTGGPYTQIKLGKMSAVAKETNFQPGQTSKDSGRPSGTKSPQTTKKVSPVGQGQKGTPAKSVAAFSLSKVTDNLILASSLNKLVEAELRKKNKIKRLNKNQKEVAEGIASVIVANEDPKNWKKKVSAYVAKPVDTNPDRIDEIQGIALEHQVDQYLASILYVSKT
jgi:hypothetical protein